jgi:hypothetical protein
VHKMCGIVIINPLNAELNSICHLQALLGGATIVVVSRIKVNRKQIESCIIRVYTCILATCHCTTLYQVPATHKWATGVLTVSPRRTASLLAVSSRRTADLLTVRPRRTASLLAVSSRRTSVFLAVSTRRAAVLLTVRPRRTAGLSAVSSRRTTGLLMVSPRRTTGLVTVDIRQAYWLSIHVGQQTYCQSTPDSRPTDCQSTPDSRPTDYQSTSPKLHIRTEILKAVHSLHFSCSVRFAARYVTNNSDCWNRPHEPTGTVTAQVQLNS